MEVVKIFTNEADQKFINNEREEEKTEVKLVVCLFFSPDLQPNLDQSYILNTEGKHKSCLVMVLM